jgi:hypothetical protein
MKRFYSIAILLAATAGAICPASADEAKPPEQDITEITLSDIPSLVLPPPVNEIVLRADGNLYWTTGDEEHKVRHAFPFPQESFQRLAVSFETHHFWELDALYDHRQNPDGTIEYEFDGMMVSISAVKSGQRKTVQTRTDYSPVSLWELEMLIRGVTSGYQRRMQSSPP